MSTAAVSASTPAAPVSPPTAPSNLTASAASATSINLAWNDNSNNESGFKIERSTNGGTTFIQIAVTSSDVRAYTDNNLTQQTTYTYRLRATNSAGDSNYSANAAAMTPAALNMATYSYLSANVLAPKCAGCHGGNNPSAGISYASYNATLATVVKGNAAGSRLYTSIVSGRMPPGTPLNAAQIDAIKTWIDAGALNN
ncbi:MAG: hypothetical protein HC902_03280 [Calothrix sp. SM1_5_4]|nr:hypothetical protein [Calothrix sp. SM1_5_4]